MKHAILVALVALHAAGTVPCSGAASPASPTADRHAEARPHGYRVSSDGIGPYRIGARASGPERPEPGITLRFEEGRLCSIRTDDPRHRTAEGMGVGTPFAVFEAVYGRGEVEAASGRIRFDGKATRYDITVAGMPNRGIERPPPSGKILAIAVDDCPDEPE